MKFTQTRLVLLLLASALWAIAGTGCNTFRGLGQDIENAGSSIQKSAN